MEAWAYSQEWLFYLVLEAGPEDGKDHEVGEGEEQAAGGGAGSFRGAGEHSQVLQGGDAPDLVQPNLKQAGYFLIGKELLAGSNA